MLTTYKRKNYERELWKEQGLERAVNAVKGKAMGINAASRNFLIPSRSLRRQIIQDN
jgi:hypothetical protein